MPSRWTTRFETWVVPKPNHPPTCLDSNAKPLDHSIWDLDSPQAKSSLNVFGFKCQAVEPPNLRLEQIWSLKLTSLTCLDSNTKPLDHSICSLGSPQVKSPLNVFGFKCQTVEPPSLRLEQIWSLKLPPSACLDLNAKPLNHPIWDLNKFEVSNYPPQRVWIQDSKPLNCPIQDWNKFQIPNSPDLFGLRISKPSNLSKLRFGQVSNPNFPRTQLSLCKSQI